MSGFVSLVEKYCMIFMLSPLKIQRTITNRIVLDNSLAHNYSDNIKYISEYLIKYFGDKFEIYITAFDQDNYSFLIEKGVKIVRPNTLEYYRIVLSCSVFITNSGGYSYLPLKKEQLVINTWHGGGCYKIMGLDKKGVSRFHKYELKLTSRKTDRFIVTCKKFGEAVKKSLLINENSIWEIGMPRNDMLINYHSEFSQSKRREIRNVLGLSKNEKLVLFSPTYRMKDDNLFGQHQAISYGLNVEDVCKALNRRFGGIWKFAFRLHPSVKEYNNNFSKNVLNLSMYEDMQELILAADVMINDFSSCMWDFMLTGKPCFTFAMDLKHYIEISQLYTPVSEWPFPRAETNEELIENIISFDEKEYLLNCQSHYNSLGGCESGIATKIVCEEILKHCYA